MGNISQFKRKYVKIKLEKSTGAPSLKVLQEMNLESIWSKTESRLGCKECEE